MQRDGSSEPKRREKEGRKPQAALAKSEKGKSNVAEVLTRRMRRSARGEPEKEKQGRRSDRRGSRSSSGGGFLQNQRVTERQA